MARLDYYALEVEMQQLLLADPSLDGVRIDVEEELLFGAETTPWVGIYLDRRDAPPEMQKIAAGTRTDFRLRFSVWCWEYSLESLAVAAERRDDLLGKVEVVLMKDRTLNTLVSDLRLEGGEFMSAKDQGSWLVGAEIVVVCDASTTTT